MQSLAINYANIELRPKGIIIHFTNRLDRYSWITMQSATIFDFNKTTTTSNWNIVDDVVMGGKSSGTFSLDKEGNGIFEN